ncbi:MAG: hypothetical protein JXL97_04715 [Bacteroidales bacterium]|nr:hypothetical protein [Bacteroidales bacterium]
MKKVLILESKSDQAKTFHCFLKKQKEYDITLCPKGECDGIEGYDFVIPSGGDSTFDYVKKHGNFKIGELEYSKNNLITFDKIKTLKIVSDIGVPIPETYTDKNKIDFFPFFYKSLREEGYRERGIIRNKEDLKKLTSENVFYQEFIWSKGTYSVGFLADRGKLITHFTQKEILSYPYHGGSGVILQRIEDPTLLKYTQMIIEETGYSGWGLTEFKYSNRIKDYVFMEVNAKFWASIKFAIFNNPLFLKILLDIEIAPKPIERVLYLDRLILSEFTEIKTAFPYLFNSRIVKSKNIITAVKDRLAGNRIKAQRIKVMK